MYGLLLDAVNDYVCTHISEEIWHDIVARMDTNHNSFITHNCYSEHLMPVLAQGIADATGDDIDLVMERLGEYFVTFIGKYGYDTILRVLGRNMRDFLNGLDNLHEYLRLSYPKLQAPSFFCDNETRSGLMLHYKSKRRGFTHYVIGQIRKVGELFYNTEVDIEILRQEESAKRCHIILKLHFDNTDFRSNTKKLSTHLSGRSMNSDIFFRMFPFHVVFGRNMMIRHVGDGLKLLMESMMDKRVDHVFELKKPPISFTYENILAHTNNFFEIVSVSEIKRRGRMQKTSTVNSVGGPGNQLFGGRTNHSDSSEEDTDEMSHLRLKGQMKFIPSWEAFIFMATPVLETLEKMYHLGVYINDLSMHDASRDMVLVGTAHSKELKDALYQARQKSRKLEDTVRLLDTEIQRSDSLLYQMIPREVADRLRHGEPAMDTCQTIDEVSVLFSEVIGWANITTTIPPLEVVTILNQMYSKFDNLTEVHKVYKVETIGDAYMVVAGAPTPSRLHALKISDMALDMLEAVQSVDNPADEDGHLQIKIGINSGQVVAGVVGLRAPRYCLFGDTVNTASRMESNGESMKIHISKTTHKLLSGYPYITEKRENPIEVKGKGKMTTYWMTSRVGPGCNLLQAHSPAPSQASFSGDDVTLLRGGGDRSMSRCTYTPVTFEQLQGSSMSLQDSDANSSHTLDPRQSRQRVEAAVPSPDVSAVSSVELSREHQQQCAGSATCRVM